MKKEEFIFNIGDLIINTRQSNKSDAIIKEVLDYGKNNNKKILEIRELDRTKKMVTLSRMFRLATEKEITKYRLKILFLEKNNDEKED
jgi:predicted Zn-dependent peptidase